MILKIHFMSSHQKRGFRFETLTLRLICLKKNENFSLKINLIICFKKWPSVLSLAVHLAVRLCFVRPTSLSKFLAAGLAAKVAVRFRAGRTFGRPSLFWPANSAVQIFGRRPGRLILAAFGPARLGRRPTLISIYAKIAKLKSDKITCFLKDTPKSIISQSPGFKILITEEELQPKTTLVFTRTSLRVFRENMDSKVY
ncbi:hypothetical protein BpHYR1_041847 [Brachionus plicatilis]|uniref:Uncharacterized protein n=1 Tax=Brachionus plicatilis TaxID=10195 RepID=A0A3M7QAW6_BRAPC|nr:hypothetical protein BpHYR1_041847 [Brachionus plicatilis]